jgi:hypothetical protein
LQARLAFGGVEQAEDGARAGVGEALDFTGEGGAAPVPIDDSFDGRVEQAEALKGQSVADDQQCQDKAEAKNQAGGGGQFFHFLWCCSLLLKGGGSSAAGSGRLNRKPCT